MTAKPPKKRAPPTTICARFPSTSSLKCSTAICTRRLDRRCRTRLPSLPAAAHLTLAPDWIYEVLSTSSETLDRGKKLRIYAREGVAHAWLVDPLAHTLEVMSLEAGRWTQLGSYEGGTGVRAAPFDAIELGALWI